MIKGKDLILSIDGMPVAAAKSCDISLDRDTIEVCSPASGMWKTYKPTTCGWSANVNGLCANMANADLLNEMLIQGKRVLIRVYDAGMCINRYGYAYLTQCSQTGAVGSLVQFSASLRGTGSLTRNANTPQLTLSNVSDKAIEFIDGNSVRFEQGDKDVIYYNITLTHPSIIRVDSIEKWVIAKRSWSYWQQDVETEDAVDYEYSSETSGQLFVIQAAGTYCFMSLGTQDGQSSWASITVYE